MIDHVSSVPVGSGKIVSGVTACEVDGAEEVTCDVCQRVFTRTIPAHKYVKESEVAATCSAEGSVTYKCSVCGATKVESVEKLEHTYEVVADASLAATCEKTGLKLKVCSVCGDKVTEVIPALGHKKPDVGVKTGFVSFDEKGNYVKENGKVKVTEKNAADCENDLVEVYDCANDCGTEIVNVVTKKLGHRIDTTKTVQEGIIKITGKDEDGNNIYEKDNKGVYVVTTGNVDCTHAKVKIYTCANANCSNKDNDNEVIVVLEEATKHTPLAGSTVVYGATCEEPGYTTYTCTTCNQQIKEEETEKALGHSYQYVKETCTTGAMVKCIRCSSTVTSGEDFEKACEAAGVTATTSADLPEATGHKIIQNNADNTAGYCANESKWIEGEAIAVHQDDTVPADTNNYTNNGGKVDEELSDRMENVDIDIDAKNNIVTIKQTGEFEKIEADNHSQNAIGIMLDVGIKAKDLKKACTTSLDGATYTIEDSDIDLEQLQKWNPNANEYSFMIWLTPTEIGNGLSITFEDSTDYIKLPVTVKFVFDAGEFAE